ncbi:MAG: GntR family transcriptional regulator [Pseudomonadota bacterium]
MTKHQDLKYIVDDAKNRFRSASDFAIHSLREAILAGVLAQGTPLRQEELARTLSVSRMPIRDALRVLESEGLVSFKTHHGFSVTKFDVAQMVETARIRYSLESLALRQAIPNHTAASLEAANHLLVELNQTTPSPKAEETHRDFHLALYRPCHMERLLSLVETHLVVANRYLRLETVHRNATNQNDYSQHVSLYEACVEQDQELAEAILHAHIVKPALKLAQQIEESR